MIRNLILRLIKWAAPELFIESPVTYLLIRDPGVSAGFSKGIFHELKYPWDAPYEMLVPKIEARHYRPNEMPEIQGIEKFYKIGSIENQVLYRKLKTGSQSVGKKE